ncbi:MAG: hypothetical protein QOH01_1388 [Verrucomicrobiota bacterium]|jgi:hypothetical protein
MSALLGLLMAFFAYGRLVLKPSDRRAIYQGDTEIQKLTVSILSSDPF